MHVNDIGDALQERDIGAMESAFQALVALPYFGRIEGVQNADILSGLLDRVATALGGDKAKVPAITADIVETLSGVGNLMGAYDTYSGASQAMLSSSAHWRTLYFARTRVPT